MKTVWSFVLVCLSLSCFSQYAEDEHRILNQFIVMLKPQHKIETLLQQETFVGRLTNKRCLSPRMGIYLLEKNTTTGGEDFLNTLKRNEAVKLAQFNHQIQQRSLIPNDPSFNQQWNMLNTGQQGGVAGADIEATEAWAIDSDAVTVNGDTVVVAIIDDMFDLNQEDINFFTNYSEVPGNGIDDDGNGYIDDVNGWNVFDTTGNVNSSGWNASHSTHVAGIAGAVGNNGKGVAGVCWGAKILPVAGSSTLESEVVAAYDYVRNMRMLYNNTFGSKGAYVVSTNSSFGVDNGKPEDYPIWCAMYDSMGSVGILSAAATANANTNVDVAHDIPTECPSPWLITVTNTTRTDAKSTAGYGKTDIDLGAPGTGVWSTLPQNLYGPQTGTSMACPHVAGAVGAMFSAACKGLIDRYEEQPDSIALKVKEYLLDGAEWISSLNNITVTNGRLNLYRAFISMKKYNCDSCGFSVAANTTPVTCKSANDGQATLTFDPGNFSDYAVVWSNGFSDSVIQDLTPGFYTATVTDNLTGCTRVAAVAFHNPDSIKVNSISTNAAVGGNPGNITVNAVAGADPLLYSLDGITYQTTATFSVPSNGNYTVYIKNSTGCVTQRNVVVSGVEEISNSDLDFQIYPNPASDGTFTVYSLQFESSKTSLEVFDITGRKIFETVPQSSVFKFSSSILQSGTYFIKVANAIQKFTVLH